MAFTHRPYTVHCNANIHGACLSVTCLFAEAARLIGQAWQALPGEERAPYREMEQRDRERYAREMKKYEAELRAHIAIHGTAATGASKRMLAAASNRPKRGRSAYIFFFMVSGQHTGGLQTSKPCLVSNGFCVLRGGLMAPCLHLPLDGCSPLLLLCGVFGSPILQ